MRCDRSSPSTSSITSAVIRRAPLDAIDLRDVRMIERGEDFGFALETGQAVRVPGERGGQHLDGDLALQVRVGRPVDLAHAAVADLGGHFIGTEACPGCQSQTCGNYSEKIGCADSARSRHQRYHERAWAIDLSALSDCSFSMRVSMAITMTVNGNGARARRRAGDAAALGAARNARPHRHQVRLRHRRLRRLHRAPGRPRGALVHAADRRPPTASA